MHTDEEAANRLRTQLFRAYWLDGMDISSEVVLVTLAKEIDVPIRPATSQTIKLMQEWQKAWENGGFDKRIPSMDADPHNPLVGFPTLSDLLLYANRLKTEEDNKVRAAVACMPEMSQ